MTLSQTIEAWRFEPAGRYPEGVTYDPKGSRFLVSSLKEGIIGSITPAQGYQVFSQDSELISVAGLKVDSLRNRLLAVVHDDGASTRSRLEQKEHLARLVVFDLTTRKKLFSVALNQLVPGRSHGNDLTLDQEGNAYVTDSFQPVIYKVTPEGKPSVFLQDEAFRKTSSKPTEPALNGITCHPDGFLLVSDFEKGRFWRIPLQQPARFQPVQLPSALKGSDGIYLIDANRLAVARTFEDSTKAFISQVDVLQTSDNWQSARVVIHYRHPSLDCPTTVTAVGPTLYVANSKYKELFEKPESGHRTRQFTLTKITMDH